MASATSQTDNGQPNGNSKQPIVIPPLTVEEEDAIIHTRIVNDERPLKRVVKKFHSYTMLAYPPYTLPSSNTATAIQDAREAFLVELASFHLMLKKSAMICEAEARQVEEYRREKQRIEDDHGKLKGQIEQLKTSLEHAQMERRRKIEYDLVAEKINTLPTRQELEQSISALENDMAAIRAEHEHQNNVIQGQKAALDTIIGDLGSLRLMSKEKDVAESNAASPPMTPAADLASDSRDTTLDVERGASGGGDAPVITSDSVHVKRERDDEGASSDDVPLSAGLNASASPFVPKSRQNSLRLATPSTEQGAISEDIEMGEVEEDKMPRSKKKVREELEEGEASDSSSALSDPPDD